MSASAPVTPIAYRLSDPRLPWSRASLYRWEELGLIKLIRAGGKTMVSHETVEGILAGRIALPPHPSRQHRPEIKARFQAAREARKAKKAAP
jgi:hypothetical protein